MNTFYLYTLFGSLVITSVWSLISQKRHDIAGRAGTPAPVDFSPIAASSAAADRLLENESNVQ